MHFQHFAITAAFLTGTLAHPLDSRATSSSSAATAKITSAAAFTSGAGNKDPSSILSTGVGKGTDSYSCYSGSWESFPPSSKWVSFDAMWNKTTSYLKESCANTGAFGPGDSQAQIDAMYDSIVKVSEASLVDPRFIFATILQESSGCVNIDTSKNPDPSQPDNPGLMQSVGGVKFVGNSASASAQAASIHQMIVDGVQGTSKGDGLVQCINQYGNIFEAARCYNSGEVNKSNLNDPKGATPSYVNDIANYMTGWLDANSKWGSCKK
ncbi:glycoside hydrolase protein [Rutstroemia sp. NJR-2017a BBW]|nr:glycoside hydrolase protein [Rutstroemia sp. NJR-2017a BBW]